MAERSPRMPWRSLLVGSRRRDPARRVCFHYHGNAFRPVPERPIFCGMIFIRPAEKSAVAYRDSFETLHRCFRASSDRCDPRSFDQVLASSALYRQITGDPCELYRVIRSSDKVARSPIDDAEGILSFPLSLSLSLCGLSSNRHCPFTILGVIGALLRACKVIKHKRVAEPITNMIGSGAICLASCDVGHVLHGLHSKRNISNDACTRPSGRDDSPFV